MSPSAAIESKRMFSLTTVRPAYQTIERTPIQIVDVLGVRWRGWMRAK